MVAFTPGRVIRRAPAGLGQPIRAAPPLLGGLDVLLREALGIHVLYFWTAPTTHLYELRRVLRAEGRLVLGFRSIHDTGAADFPASIYSFYETEKVLQLFEQAGFENVRAASTAGGLTLATGSRRAD